MTAAAGAGQDQVTYLATLLPIVLGVLIVVGLLLVTAAHAPEWWRERRLRRAEQARAARLAAHGRGPAPDRGLDSFPVPPPQPVTGPVSLHLEVDPTRAPAELAADVAWHLRRTAALPDDRRVDVGPPAELAERRRVDVGRAGRHRRDAPVVDDPLTMTGFTRQLDAAAIAADARMHAAAAAETTEHPAAG